LAYSRFHPHQQQLQLQLPQLLQQQQQRCHDHLSPVTLNSLVPLKDRNALNMMKVFQPQPEKQQILPTLKLFYFSSAFYSGHTLSLSFLFTRSKANAHI
jgi:hypothetical protein